MAVHGGHGFGNSSPVPQDAAISVEEYGSVTEV